MDDEGRGYMKTLSRFALCTIALDLVEEWEKMHLYDVDPMQSGSVFIYVQRWVLFASHHDSENCMITGDFNEL